MRVRWSGVAIVAAMVVGTGAARAQDDGVPREANALRTADAEIRAALFELVDGRPYDALARLRRLGRVAPATLTAPEIHGEADRQLLIAECYYELGMDDSLRTVGDSLLAGPMGPQFGVVVRSQLIVSAYRTGDDARARQLAAGLVEPMRLGLTAVVAGMATARRGDSAAARAWFSGAAEGGGLYAPYARTLATLIALPPDSAHAAAALAALTAANGTAGGGKEDAGALGSPPAAGADIADQVKLATAQLAYEAADYERAASLAGAIGQGSAADPSATRTRAWALRRAGHTELARSALMDLAHRYPALPDRADATLMTGQMALDAGNVGDAVRTFSDVADTTRADAATVAQWIAGAGPAAAAKALVGAESGGPVEALLSRDIGLGKVLAFQDSSRGAEGALTVARMAGGAVIPGIADTAFLGYPVGVAAAAVESQVQSAIAVATPAVPNAALVPRIVLAREGGADSAAARAGVGRGIQAIREADVAASAARAAIRAEQAAAVRQVVLLERERATAASAADSLAPITEGVQSIDDSLVFISAAVDAKAARLRRLFAAQVSLTREMATDNSTALDSARRAAQPSASPEDVATLDREAQIVGAYQRVADTVEQGLARAMAHHPAFALRDTIRLREQRVRLLVDETRAAIVSGTAALDTALARARAIVADSTAPTPARAALASALARRQGAVAMLTAAVERDLRARGVGLAAEIERVGQAAAYAMANARFLRYVTAGDTAPAAWRDSAIVDLQNVLARYPGGAGRDQPVSGRPTALYELGELLVRRADAEFAASQRSAAGGGSTFTRPDYSAAIPRLEELVTRYPSFPQLDGAAYTLGTLYAFDHRYADAAKMFELLSTRGGAPQLRDEALFRLGDARFELASLARGDERRNLFAQAADAYARAAAAAPPGGDIAILALYKLGWAYYSEASPQHPDGYHQAADVFGRLVDAYDSLPPDRQARLGLRAEALEYMAVSFTQIGGAEAANRYFATRPDTADRVQVLRRVAAHLRDQGDFAGAVQAYEQLMAVAPRDTGAIAAQHEVIDIYMNRTLEPEKAQAARLAFIDRFAPGFAWSSSNAALAKEAAALREQTLREAAQYEMSKAEGSAAGGSKSVGVGVSPPTAGHYAAAAKLYEKYLTDYGTSDSARTMNTYLAEALFGAGEYARAGAEYTRAATAYAVDTANPTVRQQEQVAAQNAIVAYDSALVHVPKDTVAQDSLFAAVNRYAERYPHTDLTKRALVEEGHRASEAGRWNVVARTFRMYAAQYPGDSYTPTAIKLVGDALYKQGDYVGAQAVWDSAATVAARSGRRGLADTLKTLQTNAASVYADSLVKAGRYQEAAQTVYVAFADRNPTSPKAPDALRDAIETYVTADSVARMKGDTAAAHGAREQAIALSNRLVTSYPSYKYRQQYQTLAADLLAQSGREAESVDALRKMIADNPTWPGRADAEIRVAVRLDSLGKKSDAAAAYERFAADYPKDSRAHDALYNAAATYLEGHDTTAAARVYGVFATKFADDMRAGAARVYRMNLLQASGDTIAANAELARLCGAPPPELRPRCAVRSARVTFAAAVSAYHAYRPIKLVIPTRAQLTAAGVKRASAKKQEMLAALTRDFTKVIESGDPELLSAASFYVGAAQWDYGTFLRDVQLPPSLSDAERTAAAQGAAQQAEAYFTQAKETWAGLTEKAKSDLFTNKWVDRAHDALVNGQVPNDL